MSGDDPIEESPCASFDDALLALAAELAPPMAAPSDLRRGTIVGEHFVIERELGKGGMGVVYAALDTRLERVVALKLVRDPEVGRSAVRLGLEAKAMAKLAHPNVVAVFEVGQHERSLFIAMELVDGESARQWVRARTRTTDEVVDVYLQAAAGLAAAHDAGLVHRDFKPDNVLVGRDGRARVADFGLARAWDATHAAQHHVTGEHSGGAGLASDAVAGTSGYVAPELYAGAPPTPRSDQFAFGVALFEALFGFTPFRRRAGRIAYTSASQQLRRTLPEWLVDAIQRAIEEDPADRFPSMQALVDAIVRGRERVRRRRLGVAAVVVLGIAVAASLAIGRALREPPCTDAETIAASVYGDVKRAAIEEAAANDRASTRATLRVAVGMLDAWVARWIEHRRDACLATRVHASQSDALLDRANACLDERLADLGVLADALVTSAAVRERADAHASALRQTAPCRDTRYLAARGAPIEDPDDRAEAERIRIGLHRNILATTETADLADRRARADELLADATRLGHGPTIATAEFSAAKLAIEADDRAHARARLRHAYLTAASSGDDDVAAGAALALAFIAGVVEDRRDAAEPWLDVVQAGIDSHRVDPKVRAGLEATRSMLFQRAQDYDAAIVAARKAVELATEAEDFYEANHARMELAGSLDLAGKSTDAIAEYDLVVDELTQSYGEGHPLLAVALTNRGLAHYNAHDFANALVDQRRALALDLEFLGETGYTADRMLNLGLVLLEIDEIAEGVALIERGLAIWRPLGPPREYAPFLDALGRAALLRHEPTRALEYVDEAIAIRLALPVEQQDGIADSYRHRGDAQLSLGRVVEARESFREALRRSSADHPARAEPLYGAARAAIAASALEDAVGFVDELVELAMKVDIPASLVARARFERAIAWWRIDARPVAIEEARRARADLVAAVGDGHASVIELDAAAARWFGERHAPP